MEARFQIFLILLAVLAGAALLARRTNIAPAILLVTAYGDEDIVREAASQGLAGCLASARLASPKMNQRVASSLAVQPWSPRSACNSSGS